MTHITKLLQAVSGIMPSEHVDMMWSTLVTGIVVVFLILLLLVFFLWALGKVMSIQPKSKIKPAEKPAAAPVVVPAIPAAPEEYDDDDDNDDEIIAVIAAAIAAYGEAEGKQYRIASVKRKEKSLRSSWSVAGINENTRPF